LVGGGRGLKRPKLFKGRLGGIDFKAEEISEKQNFRDPQIWRTRGGGGKARGINRCLKKEGERGGKKKKKIG